MLFSFLKVNLVFACIEYNNEKVDSKMYYIQDVSKRLFFM